MDEEAYVVTQINQAIAGPQDLTADVEVVENRERQSSDAETLCKPCPQDSTHEFFQPSA